MKQHGVVLVTILLFLFIFSLLALTGLSSSQQQLRMSNNLVAQNQFLQAVEAGLIAGEKVLLASPNSPCIKDNNLSSEPWLVGNSCVLSYNAQPVHYVIRRSYADVCLVTGVGMHGVALLQKGDIYQITAWVQQQHQPVMILQTTYARAQGEDCENPLHEIRPGRLSWREVYATN